MSECYNCVKPLLYQLENEPIKGWCESCAICPEKDCGQPYTNRVYWDAPGYRLYRDVCELHTENTPSGCHCSENVVNKRVVKYKYLG